MSMFTIRQKLLLCGSVFFSVLLIAGSYFGSRWLHGPDVRPVPEFLLSDRPRAVSMNRPDRASVLRDASSMSETDLMSEEEDVHETMRQFVQTAPFGAKTNSLDEESQTVRVPRHIRLTWSKIEVDYLLAYNLLHSKNGGFYNVKS